MGTERGGCSRLMKTPRHSDGAYIKQEHEKKNANDCCSGRLRERILHERVFVYRGTGA